MLTGSIASSLQGEPRSTHDIDIVVNLPQSKANALAASFPPAAYKSFIWAGDSCALFLLCPFGVLHMLPEICEWLPN